MSEETKNPETNEPEKEDTPEWAKNLTETINDLPNRLKEILSPAAPEAPPVTQPIEIPLPQEPEQEKPPQPQEVEPEQEPEKPKKKRSFLDWLL